jgi:ribosomal protein S27AE
MSMADDRITCTRCGRRIVPRLWHYGGGWLFHTTTQHLCPFCGVVLYETGGGVRWGCLLLLLALAWPFILSFIYAAVKTLEQKPGR